MKFTAVITYHACMSEATLSRNRFSAGYRYPNRLAVGKIPFRGPSLRGSHFFLPLPIGPSEKRAYLGLRTPIKKKAILRPSHDIA